MEYYDIQMKKIYITSFWISIKPDEEDVDNEVEENDGIDDGDDADFSTDGGGVDDLCIEMLNGGDVIDNIVNDDSIDVDGFVDSISAENVIDDWVVGDELAVADTGNAAVVHTFDNDLAAVHTFDNDFAADNTIDRWVVSNNSGDDDTSDNDGFGNNFDADDTTDDKVVGDNATNDANEDEDVGVNVVAFDTVDDEKFGVNAVSKDDTGFDDLI